VFTKIARQTFAAAVRFHLEAGRHHAQTWTEAVHVAFRALQLQGGEQKVAHDGIVAMQ
jgi:hypothetical protein